MNPKEKFDIIVDEIERLANGVEDQEGYVIYYDKREICERAFAAAKCYLSEKREKNALFQFLLEKRVNEYIDERKMMAAYRCILKGEQGRGYSKAIQISGQSTQPRFIENFKSYFIITPEVAAEQKDDSLLLPVANWDYITENDRYALEVAKATGYYRLNERECKLALELRRKYRVGIKEACEYIYNYVWMFIEDGIDDDDRDSDIEFYLRDKNILKMYFEYKFTMDDIFNVLLAKEIKIIPRRLEECDKMYLEGCLRCVNVQNVIDYPWFEKEYNAGELIFFYEEYYQYYKKRSDERYTYYDGILFFEICGYYDKEKAFEVIEPGHSSYESIQPQIEEIKTENFEKEIERLEEEDKRIAKRMEDDERRRCEEEWEGYTKSSWEENMYNPDFFDEGYMPSYETETEYGYDYEPDFDEPEWIEENYLSVDDVEVPSEDAMVEEHMNGKLEEGIEGGCELLQEDSEFEKLCEETKQHDDQKRLSVYSNFNVKNYIKQRKKYFDELDANIAKVFR